MRKNRNISMIALLLGTLCITGCDFLMPKKNSNQSRGEDSSYYTSGDSYGDYSSSDGGSSNIDIDTPETEYELSDEGFKKLIKDSYGYCEDLVEQGSVLLKNDNNTLPLKQAERRVTLLGQGSRNIFYRSGSCGAAPNDNLVVTLDQAFENNGFVINHNVFDMYDTLSTIGSNAVMTNPNSTIEHSFSGFYTDAMKQSFSEYGDAAIVTFVRVGTENIDPSNGQLDLKTDEKQLLQMIKEKKDDGTFKKVIVLINSPMPMSTDWVNDPQYGIDACLFVGAPGYYGAGGIVHLLMGHDQEGNVVNPSGHAPDTFAASASSSPAMVNALNSSISVYKEGVYVGYKYYETRYEDAVLGQGNASGTAGVYKSNLGWDYASEMGFPFGFGLSYTTFNQKLSKLSYDRTTDKVNAIVEVENTGDMDGKASVQLYVQAPYTDFDKQNNLGKSSIALMAYDKVDVKAHSKETVNLSFDRYQLATYDYRINERYILEEGDYYFGLGNGAHEALNNIIAFKEPSISLVDHNGDPYLGNNESVGLIHFDQDKNTYKYSIYNGSEITNQFDDADYNYMAEKNGTASQITYLDRQDWQATWPTQTTTNPATSLDSNMSQYYKKEYDCPSYINGDGVKYNVIDGEVITFSEMSVVPLEGTVKEGRFKGQEGADVWDKFIKQMTLDDLAISVSDYRGIFSVDKVKKPGSAFAEGPEGLLARFKFGDKRWATGFPTGPVYTGTWDHKMQKKFGSLYGEEALFAGVNCVNGPGTNIIRIPYTSRASEYMSEDGILNYYTAANIVGAARSKGLIMNIKHCFLNNQENGRQKIHTYCNEQAIREIYLKGFEGALTKGQGLGVMTSYNRIGARYAACHEPLMKNVMRGEWGYQGFIMDDALTGSNNDSYSNGPAMLHAGTDIFCLDGARGNQLKQWVTQNDDGQILADLQRANKYIMYAMSRSRLGLASSYQYNFGSNSEIVREQESWDFNYSGLTSLSYANVSDYELVYVFEGIYTEGYQGQYNTYSGSLYLLTNGMYVGKLNSTEIRGYWYNSSLKNSSNTPDCLNLVSDISHYESIVCTASEGSYQFQALVHFNPGWGEGRAMIMNGYKY